MRDGVGPGELGYRPRAVGVVKIWKVVGTGDRGLSFPGAAEQGVCVSTPCGAVSTRGVSVLVPWLSGLLMYGWIPAPAIVPYPPRVALEYHMMTAPRSLKVCTMKAEVNCDIAVGVCDVDPLLETICQAPNDTPGVPPASPWHPVSCRPHQVNVRQSLKENAMLHHLYDHRETAGLLAVVNGTTSHVVIAQASGLGADSR